MYNTLKKLVEKHFYATKAEVVDKLDVFFMMSRITADQYAELMMLAGEVYG